MKSRILSLLAGLAACLLSAGCAEYGPYPASYQLPIGAPYLTSEFGPLNMSVNAVQEVNAQPGEKLYYQVVSPTTVQIYVYDPYGQGQILSQFEGSTFNSAVRPNGDRVKFIISAIQPVPGGFVQLTVSDNPIGRTSLSAPFGTPPAPPVVIQPATTTTVITTSPATPPAPPPTYEQSTTTVVH